MTIILGSTLHIFSQTVENTDRGFGSELINALPKRLGKLYRFRSAYSRGLGADHCDD